MKTLLFVILIMFGAFMFVFGEFDDSPGAQLLGLVSVTYGIVKLVKRKKKSSG